MLETKRLNELALIGLQLERKRIDSEIGMIEERLNEGAETPAARPAPHQPIMKPQLNPIRTATHPRTISPEGRKRLSLLAKRRWKVARQNGKATL